MTREEVRTLFREYEIWQAMKAGKKFKFEDGSIGYIVRIDLDFRHFLSSNNNWYSHAEPVEPTYRVKDPVSIMKALVDDGYQCNNEGDWVCPWKINFERSMFRYCGTIANKNDYEWRSEWLEEVYE